MPACTTYHSAPSLNYFALVPTVVSVMNTLLTFLGLAPPNSFISSWVIQYLLQEAFPSLSIWVKILFWHEDINDTQKLSVQAS